jgi:hypothetical protein
MAEGPAGFSSGAAAPADPARASSSAALPPEGPDFSSGPAGATGIVPPTEGGAHSREEPHAVAKARAVMPRRPLRRACGGILENVVHVSAPRGKALRGDESRREYALERHAIDRRGHPADAARRAAPPGEGDRAGAELFANKAKVTEARAQLLRNALNEHEALSLDLLDAKPES